MRPRIQMGNGMTKTSAELRRDVDHILAHRSENTGAFDAVHESLATELRARLDVERWVDTRIVRLDDTVVMGKGYDFEPWECMRLEMHSELHGSFAIWPDRIGNPKAWSLYHTPSGSMAFETYRSKQEAQHEAERMLESMCCRTQQPPTAEPAGVDVTPAMAQAGADALEQWEDSGLGTKNIAAKIFIAMTEVNRSAPIAEDRGRDGSSGEIDSDGHVWPDSLMIRDTKLHDDIGGGGQRIYTTAGRGYKKVEYVRANRRTNVPPVVDGEEVIVCGNCGCANEITISWEQDKIPTADFGELSAVVPIRTCNVCEFSWYTKLASEIREQTVLAEKKKSAAPIAAPPEGK